MTGSAWGKRVRGWAGCMGLAFAASVQAAPGNWDQLPVDRLIVKFKPQATQAVARSLQDKTLPAALQRLDSLHQVKSRLIRRVATGAHVVRLEQSRSLGELDAVLRDLINDPDVEFVEPDLRVFPALVPNDPLYASQWSLQELAGGIRADLAWDSTLGTGLVVAVLDTGIRPHSDLVANLLPGYDFVSDTFMGNDGNGRDADPSDPGDGVAAGGCGSGVPSEDEASSWHGTHVAGIVAARGLNGQGIAGVAPEAGLLPLRVLGRCGGYTSDVTDAIYWAAGYAVAGVPNNPNPARVINLSLSSSVQASCSQTYANAIDQARAAGAVVVTAAGNRNTNADLYPPGNCPNAFTVAASNRSGGRADYSNYGSLVDVAAPGGSMRFLDDPGGILSTANNGSQAPAGDSFVYYQGTSMAAPHVAGVAALLFAAKPAALAEEVEDLLRASARPFPAACNGCGAGIVNADLAVGVISGQVATSLPADLALVFKGTNGKFVKDANVPGEGTISYQAEISNVGPETATDVEFSNLLPLGVTVESIQPSQGICSIDGTACALGDLSLGAKATVAVVVRTTNDQKMDFQGQVGSALYDPDLTNNFVIKRMGGSLGLSFLVMLLMLAGRRFCSIMY